MKGEKENFEYDTINNMEKRTDITLAKPSIFVDKRIWLPK